MRNKTLCWWKNEQLVCFEAKFNFYFLFFPDRHTLKFLKMKCNPTNKKNCGLMWTDGSRNTSASAVVTPIAIFFLAWHYQRIIRPYTYRAHYLYNNHINRYVGTRYLWYDPLLYKPNPFLSSLLTSCNYHYGVSFKEPKTAASICNPPTL